MQVAQTPSRKIDLIVLDENRTLLSPTIGTHIDGIIGGSYFKNTVLEIDYKRRRLIMHNVNDFKSSSYSDHDIIPLRIERNKPYAQLDCSIRGDTTHSLSFLFDTGSAVPIILYDDRADIVIPDSTLAGNIGHGLGGWLVGRSAKIYSLKLGNYILKQPIVHFQELQNATDSIITDKRDGLIGGDLLDAFSVIIDYVHSVAYLKGNKNWQDPIAYDRSGLTVMSYGHQLNRFIIQNIIPDSPAEEAGLQRGDIIKKVGIWPASWLSLGLINKRFRRKAGKTVRLKVSRGGEILHKKILLRDLL